MKSQAAAWKVSGISALVLVPTRVVVHLKGTVGGCEISKAAVDLGTSAKMATPAYLLTHAGNYNYECNIKTGTAP